MEDWVNTNELPSLNKEFTYLLTYLLTYKRYNAKEFSQLSLLLLLFALSLTGRRPCH